ncbi:MAG: methionine biosynthesis protein MetW [Actinomycetota bacterium]
MDESDEVVVNTESPPDIDELVALLRARVEARRRSGAYPPDLEEQMTAHFRRILTLRREAHSLPDLRQPITRSGQALPLRASRIPLASGLPAGEVFHKTIARLVSRQTQGALQQVQAFAEPVQAALEALATAVEDLSRAVYADIAQSIDALYERQALQERILAGLGADRASLPDMQPWQANGGFEQSFRPTGEEMAERYDDVAKRLAGKGPVLEIGCGRGDLLKVLGGQGLDASGVEIDPELVKSARALGLSVVEDDGIRYLAGMENDSLGAIVLVQAIERFSVQEVVELSALAAAKLRRGGVVLVESLHPQSLYVFAHSFFLDPTHLRPVHPAYLTFLLREAGFAQVYIEWRSAPEPQEHADGASVSLRSVHHDENTQRLSRLLVAPEDYVLTAVR